MTLKLSHVDDQGKARMVDVSHKPVQFRKAVASGNITLEDNTLKLIRENAIKKGDVLTVAQIAGIQAAKKTGELIPLCHPLALSDVSVETHFTEHGVAVTATVKTTGQTGVEMEALTAVSTALLTIYDMCKAVDKKMVIHDIKLISKEKSDTLLS